MTIYEVKGQLLISSVLLASCLLASCNKQKGHQESIVPKENKTAKSLLQGIWINEDSEDIAFRAKGDSIFYPDTTSIPVAFQVIGDTLVLQGANVVKYPIEKQAAHLFVFKNQNGETVRLVKSENPDDVYAFEGKQPQPINQRQLIKRDTVVVYGKDRYHCYVQVNPTTYKVMKTSYNDEGVEVQNIYYDNIVHMGVFKGGTKLFSSNFYKNDFKAKVPAEFLSKCVLSDLVFNNIDAEGVHYNALLGIPDSPTSFVVEVLVSLNGKVVFRNVD